MGCGKYRPLSRTRSGGARPADSGAARGPRARAFLGLFLALRLGGDPGELVHGVTISCQTWGREWGSDGFGAELDDLATLGVNWVSIHPYARIDGDGEVRWRALDPERPPPWLARPIEEAHRRGIQIMIIPHLAYWGSPFAWRGDIDFEGPALERFFRTYAAWIVDVARATRDADAFAVGNETDRLLEHETEWRGIIAAVRGVTAAKLTYGANHTDFERVPFWDALDAVGVQAYFPLAAAEDPSVDELRRGWQSVLERLRAVHLQTGKPVVFTELGYNRSLAAAREPWDDRLTEGPDAARAEALQLRCYEVGLGVLEEERAWLRGAFLWKWFVGDPGRGDGDFLVDSPPLRRVIASRWGAATPARR